jgi:hypothetical protein
MKFQAPAGTTNIAFEQDVFTAANGVVEMPASIGQRLGFTAIEGDDAPKAKKADDAPKAKK